MTTFVNFMGTTIGSLDFAGPESLQPCWKIPNFFQDSGAHRLPLLTRSHLLARMCRLLARMCRMSDMQLIEVARQDCTFTVVHTYSPQSLTTDHYGRIFALSVCKLFHDDTCLDHPYWCSLTFVVPTQHSPFRRCPLRRSHGLFMDSLGAYFVQMQKTWHPITNEEVVEPYKFDGRQCEGGATPSIVVLQTSVSHENACIASAARSHAHSLARSLTRVQVRNSVRSCGSTSCFKTAGCGV